MLLDNKGLIYAIHPFCTSLEASDFKVRGQWMSSMRNFSSMIEVEREVVGRVHFLDIL